MGNRMEHEANLYLREIKRAVSFLPRKEQNLFLESLRESLENYLQENPDADREDIVRKFGSPEEIADSYLSSLETREVTKKVGIGRRRKFWVTAVAVVGIAIAMLFILNWYSGAGLTSHETDSADEEKAEEEAQVADYESRDENSASEEVTQVVDHESYDADSVSEEATSINPFDYPENSEERYIAGMAAENDYTYEQAAEVLKAQTDELDLAENEVLQYQTVDEVAGKIEDGNATALEVKITTDVMYVWNMETEEAVSLTGTVNPVLYIPELSGYTISSGDFNVAQTDTGVRLSVTASTSFAAENGEYVVGNDVSAITNQNGKSTVVTEADTYAIEFALEELAGK